MKISATILKSSVESASGSFSHLDLERDTEKGRFAQENAANPGDFIFVCLLLPVVVHVADEHGVEGVEVPAKHGKLIQDEQLRFLVVAFTVSLQQLLFSNDLRLQQFTVTQIFLKNP